MKASYAPSSLFLQFIVLTSEEQCLVIKVDDYALLRDIYAKQSIQGHYVHGNFFLKWNGLPYLLPAFEMASEEEAIGLLMEPAKKRQSTC